MKANAKRENQLKCGSNQWRTGTSSVFCCRVATVSSEVDGFLSFLSIQRGSMERMPGVESLFALANQAAVGLTTAHQLRPLQAQLNLSQPTTLLNKFTCVGLTCSLSLLETVATYTNGSSHGQLNFVHLK